MKFTVMSHAGLLVESGSTSLLVDPWLIGSCYWRSWWNFPEPDPALIADLNPDYVYITHLHWDHYHGPSLRRLDRKATILFPKAPTRRLVEDIRPFKFANVEEMTHGKTMQLGSQLEITSYQFGPVMIDSALVITDGKTVLFNVNDSKFFGLALKQILKKFPNIDFVFRSHSSASPLPYCIDRYQEKGIYARAAKDYIEEFTEFSLNVKARYAVPFASNHCFLHKDTEKFNATAANPIMVKKYFDERKESEKFLSECVIMPPGSSWDDQQGFCLRNFNYENKENYINELKQKYSTTLKKQYQREDIAQANFLSFEKYFLQLINVVPRWLIWISSLTVVFKVLQKDNYVLWLVDFKRKKVLEIQEIVAHDFMIEVHALVLNQCTRKQMFNVWGAGKRLKIMLEGADYSKVDYLFMLLDFYENEGLPLWKLFTLRQLGVRLRRWREFVDVAQLLVRCKVFKKRFHLADLYKISA